jgi:signal transduction histidine kinase
MTKKQFSYLTFFTVLITVAIIAIQVYWNWKNFYDLKKSLTVDTQTAIDNSVDEYFIEVSKKNIEDIFSYKAIPINGNEQPRIKIFNDSTHKKRKSTVYIEKIEIKSDSLKKPIVISNFGDRLNLFGNTIDFKELIAKINKTFEDKNLSTNYILTYSNSEESDYIYDNSIQKVLSKIPSIENPENFIITNSNYISDDKELKFYITDLNYVTFKKAFSSLSLSLLLSASIILCMFFLIRTIKKQKQIAEMKNDFISNISHELKTPIAIVVSAIEGIQNFNEANDKEKTEKYLQISNTELQKLNTIVEKILENATLDNTDTKLTKSYTNITDLVQKCVQKHQLKTTKTILTKLEKDQIYFYVNAFHFENCIDNLIENAVKYGGDTIEIMLNLTQKKLLIEVKDNGNSIPKHLRSKIFEKFYRIPTNNIHDVKGFGIGLYYVKQMIERHNGVVSINSQEGWTSFKISLPNE